MRYMPRNTGMSRICIAAAAAALVFQGCAWLADPDRIVVAEIDGEPIRRADLNQLLREMMPEERPLIRTRSDLLEVLEDHVDFKYEYSQELMEKG
jgi:hypothetical protein